MSQSNEPDSTLNAAYLIVDYAWAVLSENLPDTWNTANYDGLIPIVPLSEEPELDEFDGPHIVYGYAEEATGPLYAMRSGSLTFAVYDDKFRRVTKTMNTLRGAFERLDETARDINRFTTKYREGAYLSIRFGTVDIGYIEGGAPETEEGGRQSALVNIRYTYFQELDLKTEF